MSTDLARELRCRRAELRRAQEDKALAEERLRYAEQIILELRGKLAARVHQVGVRAVIALG